MTTFEFVFSLISVITSLALTRLLNGCIALFRHAGPVRWSWRHAGWIAIAYMLLVGNWAAFWRERARTQWHVLDVLLPLVFLSVLYAFCDLVMPDRLPDDETLDLREYHQRHGKRYVLVQLVFALQALLVIAIEAKDFGHWLDSARFAIVAVILSSVVLGARNTWFETAAVIGLVVLAAVFMVARLQGLSS